MALWAAGVVVALGLVAVGGWIWVRATIETPEYSVIREDDGVELRRYAPMLVAETSADGGRQAALRDGFRTLFRFISAGEREGPRIAMTAPVLQRPEGAGWAVAFVAPRDAEDVARQAAGRGVEVREVPARCVAALRLPGRPDDADWAAAEARLLGWAEAEGLTPAAPILHAFYDDPWTPGPLRRNEALLPLAD